MEIWFGLLMLLAAALADEQAWEQVGRGGDGRRERAVTTNRIGPQVITKNEEDVWPDGRRCGEKHRGEEQGTDGRESSAGVVEHGQSINRIAAWRSVFSRLSAKNASAGRTVCHKKSMSRNQLYISMATRCIFMHENLAGNR